MRIFAQMAALLAAALMIVPLIGCGGGSRGSKATAPAATRARGGLTLTVRWPEKTRVIPLAAQSIRVTLQRVTPGPSIGPVPTVPLLLPPYNNGGSRETTTTVDNLEIGEYQITVVAYSTSDATGTPVAMATVNQDVVPGTNNPLVVIPFATVDRLELIPVDGGPALAVSQSRQFGFTAYDAADNIVLVDPGAILWESLNPAILSVDATGNVTGIAPGTGQIRATYKEPNVTAGEQGTGASAVVSITVLDLEAGPWSKARADLQNTGRARFGDPTVGQTRWEFIAGDFIVFSSPVIDRNGVVYVGCYDFNLYAINPDGTEKWTFATGDIIDSTPAIGLDGTVYVGSFDGNVYAVNPNTGTEVWRYTAGGPVQSSPVVYEGVIYVGVNEPGSKLVALDAATGAEIWAAPLGTGITTTPALSLDEGTLYAGGFDGRLFAINRTTGAVTWEFPTGQNIENSSPAVGADGSIYFGTLNGDFFALNPDGTLKPNFPLSLGQPIYSAPGIASDNTVYFGTLDNINVIPDGRLYAIDGATGAQKWSVPLNEGLTSSPSIGGDGTIYVGAYDGNLYAFNPADGSVKWSVLVGNNIDSSPGIGVDGAVYVGGLNGSVFAVE